MSAIKDFSEQVNTAFNEIATGVDGILADVTFLKAKIDELQNNPGPISPEDQEILTQVQNRATSLAAKVKALDEATEEAPTPEPA